MLALAVGQGLAVPSALQAQEVPAWLQRVEHWVKDDGKEASPGAPPAAPVARRTPDAAPEGPGVSAPAQGLASGGSSLLQRLEHELSGTFAGPAEASPATESKPKPGTNRFFKYTDKNGKEVFTNVVEAVPVEQRPEAELDLSHVPLHSELGAQISARLTAEHARLADSEYCAEQRQAKEPASWRRVWDEYAPLIVCGVVLLLFLLVTPRMLRRVHAPVWSRVMTFAIPALAVAAFMTYSMMKTNRSITAFRKGSDPCQTSSLSSLSTGKDPLGAKLKLIQHLKAQVSAIDAVSAPDPTIPRGL